MLFYIKESDRVKDIPDCYTIGVMSKSRILLNRPNSIDLTMFYPDFDLSSRDEVNKRKYINQIKHNEEYLVMNFYAKKNATLEINRDQNNDNVKVMKNIVFVCDEDDIEDFDYMKLFTKFIKKKYGIKVFKLTYDISFDMIEESKMSADGEERYIKKLMKLNKKNRI